MESDGSDTDFDGFLPRDVEEAEEKQELLGEMSSCESDIDVSELSSSEDDSSDSESDDEVSTFCEWTSDTRPVREPIYDQHSGPTHNLPPEARPLDYFFLFLPQSFFETVAEETNRYAEQTMTARGKPDPIWRPTDAMEIRAYFTINIMFGVKQLPQLWNYWSQDQRYGDPYVSSIMPKSRFLKLNQYLHVRDTSCAPGRNDDGYDPLFKIRPILDMLAQKFRTVYVPGQNLSVDEGMIGFKGRLHFKQYMPAKPTKWGIKVWELCESSSGYCSNFDVYTGKKMVGERPHGLGYDVVWSLTEPFHNQNRHIYFDRLFSSVVLAEKLSEVKTYVCGTVMANRKGLPHEIRNAKLKKRGDMLQLQKGNIMATAYKDKRQILFLSTNQQPGQADDGKPFVNLKYNSNMGGVDKSDQYRAYYPVGRPGKKWWRYVLWFVVNLSIVNAYIVFQKSRKNPPPPKGYSHLKFRVDVASQLCAGYSSRKKQVGRKAKHCNTEVALDAMGLHKLEKIDGRKKVCKMCSLSNRKTPKGYQVETSYHCTFCKVALCKVCFGLFHDRNLVEQ